VLACEGPGFSVAEADRSDTVVRNTKGFSQPKVIFKIDPEYAEEARKAKDSGSVLISIVIDQMGRPKSARVVRSLGHGLDEKAVEAVSQWRFTPAMNGDKPVTTVGTIEVNFRLL
jgi:periplasmic protein TonB